MVVKLIKDLVAELDMSALAEFQLVDEDGRHYQLVDVQWSGYDGPAVLLIRPDDDTPSR